MPLLCMYVVHSRPDLSGVGGTVGCVPITGWSLLCLFPPSILGLLPFRRHELGVYCMWCASFDRITSKHLAPM
jgi:hypothetical protein